MKKVLLSIVSVCLCMVCVFSFVACKPKDYGTTTTDTSRVTSNGGSSVIYNGELYFVNGSATNDGNHNGGTMGSIYKVAVKDNGEIADNASYQKVVDCLVGYKNGSITIIGDFLYYAKPSTAKNKKGEILYNRTVFERKNLANGLTQEIYTTAENSESEEVSYAYYKHNGSVNLIVYEKTAATLKSLKMGNQITTSFALDKVTSAVFSDNMGESKTGNISADNYIFYTLAAEENAVNTQTNRVYRISADGSNKLLLQDDAQVSLLCVSAGKLVFSVSFGSGSNKIDYIYAYDVNQNTTERALSVVDSVNGKNPSENSINNLVSTSTYEDIIFLEEGTNLNELAILFIDGKVLRYLKYNKGTIVKDIKLYTFASTPTLEFVDTYTDNSLNKSRKFAIFTNKESSSSSSYLYKIEFGFDNQDQVNDASPEPVQLSLSKINDAIGNLVPKMIGNYIYVFSTDEDKNVLQYRVNFYTPKDLEEQNPSGGDDKPTDEDLKVKEGVLLGGANLS